MQNPYTPHHKGHGAIHSMHWQLQEVENVVNDLRRLLTQDAKVFDDENICREVEVLERWRDHYHRDLVTADAFCETSSLVVANLYDHLKLALEEMQRTGSDSSSSRKF